METNWFWTNTNIRETTQTLLCILHVLSPLPSYAFFDIRGPFTRPFVLISHQSMAVGC